MKISIVIPVYNEANQLAACLEAIALQSVKPYEVILVDNNSTDDTVAVAQKYDFVRVISEPRQGVIHARSLGYNLAKGDIIARLDGDSIVPKDWVASIKLIFSDPKVDAVSGVALYYNVAADYIFNAIDLFFRRRLCKQLEEHMYLWGANMALRRKAWTEVRDKLCNQGYLHEDYDIAIHMQELGSNIIFDERLRAKVSSRRIESSFISFMRYVWRSPQTYSFHNIKVWRQMAPVILVCAIGYLPGRILCKGYDPELERFKLSRLLEPSHELARVDPTANVA